MTTEADLARKVRGHVAVQLAEATVQQFVSIFETYFKAGPGARRSDGERIEVTEQYHCAIWELFRDVADATSSAAIAKAG